MDFYELVKARYSVRKYADKPVEEEKLQKVLAAGAAAPTAKNQQPQHIYVLESKEAIEKIRGITRCAFDAPVVLLVCGDKEKAWTNPFNDRNSAEMDCSIVTTQMMLQAADLGLGTTYVGMFEPEKLLAAFPEMAGLTPIALLPLGYPAENARPSRLHADRKPMEELVKYL